VEGGKRGDFFCAGGKEGGRTVKPTYSTEREKFSENGKGGGIGF